MFGEDRRLLVGIGVVVGRQVGKVANVLASLDLVGRLDGLRCIAAKAVPVIEGAHDVASGRIVRVQRIDMGETGHSGSRASGRCRGTNPRLGKLEN